MLFPLSPDPDTISGQSLPEQNNTQDENAKPRFQVGIANQIGNLIVAQRAMTRSHRLSGQIEGDEKMRVTRPVIMCYVQTGICNGNSNEMRETEQKYDHHDSR